MMDVGCMHHLEKQEWVQKQLDPPGTSRPLVFVEEKISAAHAATILKLLRATLLVSNGIFRLISGMNPLNVTPTVVHSLDSLRATM